MVHDTIPILKSKSYLKDLQIPYFRFPGFQEIKQNDIVVFSWPPDTLTNITDRYSKVDIKPLDKKSNYVKRCVGIPGDSLEVRDGYVYINGTKNELPGRARLQFGYAFRTKKQLNPSFAAQQYDITDLYPMDNPPSYRVFRAMMTDAAYERFKNHPDMDTIFKTTAEKGVLDPSTFPHHPDYQWNTDYFGPMYIPKAGANVSITAETLPLYRRIIEVYEGSEIGIENKISQSGTQVLLNGTPLSSYTFKYDYYWLMGDNRNNSQDARMWGFVPFTHVVGKPVLVWMSWNSNAKGIMNKIRWERLFTTVGGDGEPVSYFKYFLILVAGGFVFDFFRKKKKAAKK
jgi:signal peptidase I